MLRLDGRRVSIDTALQEEDNVLDQLSQLADLKKLYKTILNSKESIAALTRHHLGLGKQDVCTVLDPRKWPRGAFNLCVLVEVKTGELTRQLVFRCPMPHKVAGAVDEKVSSEVGTYAWVQEKCHDIPIPHLFGFGFSDGRQFTHSVHRPFYIRLAHLFRRRIYSLLRYPVLSQYTRHQSGDHVPLAYTLLEYIGPETGEMLSKTWKTHLQDEDHRQRLFRDLSRIILSLARIPQPRIGSFEIHNDGTITLTNRPLHCSAVILENCGALGTIQKNDTYTCTEAFVSDMVTLHDRYLLKEPNAILSEEDCCRQMAANTALRAVSHRYIKREYRNGPFLLQLTDLHQSNIFVDSNWNVTSLIDLDWTCACPAEMLDVPYWLTDCGIDVISGEGYDAFGQARGDFLQILEHEERNTRLGHAIPISKVMHDMWASKGVWFWHALTSVNNVCTTLLDDHLYPPRTTDDTPEIETVVSRLWCEDPNGFIQGKLKDRQEYVEKVERLVRTAGRSAGADEATKDPAERLND